MNLLPDKELLRVDEAAAYLRVTKKTIYSWIDVGKLEAIKVHTLIRIPRKNILKMQKSTME